MLLAATKENGTEQKEGFTGDGYPIAPMPPQVDGRTAAFSKINKPLILEKIFNGDLDISTPEAFRAARLTTKEKSALLKDERFLDMLDAKLCDYILGGEKPDKLQIQILKTVFERLNLLAKGGSSGRGRIGSISVGKRPVPPAPDPIRLQQEGQRIWGPQPDTGGIGNLKASA